MESLTREGLYMASSEEQSSHNLSARYCHGPHALHYVIVSYANIVIVELFPQIICSNVIHVITVHCVI